MQWFNGTPIQGDALLAFNGKPELVHGDPSDSTHDLSICKLYTAQDPASFLWRQCATSQDSIDCIRDICYPAGLIPHQDKTIHSFAGVNLNPRTVAFASKGFSLWSANWNPSKSSRSLAMFIEDCFKMQGATIGKSSK